MSALIPPVAPSCNAAERIHPSTTPWGGTLAAIFFTIATNGSETTDEHRRKKEKTIQLIDLN
jgi:hypothetical protein